MQRPNPRKPMLEVVPGSSVGDFALGASYIDVVSRLSRSSESGVVHVAYQLPFAEESAVSSLADVGQLELLSHKLKLRLTFDGLSGSLKKITLSNIDAFDAADVTYRESVLRSETQQPTFSQVYEVLGPTFQGDLDRDSGRYTLRYPGIEIEFPIPAAFHDAFSARGTHPTRLPNGAAPIASSLSVLPIPLSVPSELRALGRVQPGDAVSFDWTRRELIFTRSGVRIPSGICPQTLMQRLGQPPSHIFDRLDSRMGIHAPPVAPQKQRSIVTKDRYAFNYPYLGIDFIFNAEHMLEKVVLHNPIPSFDSFLRYQRCNFDLKDVPVGLEADMSLTTMRIHNLTRIHDGDGVARLTRPLISAAGCSNGLVLKVYALRDVVLYTMPSRSLVKVMLIVHASRSVSKRLQPLPSPTGADMATEVCEAPKGEAVLTSPRVIATTEDVALSPMHRTETMEGTLAEDDLPATPQAPSTSARAPIHSNHMQHHSDPSAEIDSAFSIPPPLAPTVAPIAPAPQLSTLPPDASRSPSDHYDDDFIAESEGSGEPEGANGRSPFLQSFGGSATSTVSAAAHHVEGSDGVDAANVYEDSNLDEGWTLPPSLQRHQGEDDPEGACQQQPAESVGETADEEHPPARSALRSPSPATSSRGSKKKKKR